MARKGNARRTNRTIIVVDDQPETLESLRTLLEREGHDVLVAESGEVALELFKQHDVHLLLVDYFMPRMNGEQLVRAVRHFDPFVQIILQTGYSGEKPPRVMLAELDIQGYHDKSEGPERLLLWVDVALKTQTLIERLRERERLQGELVANVSHELRTPLNIINGYAHLLIDGEFGALPDDAREPLASVCEASTNLTDLVSDFLRYAKVEAGMSEVADADMSSVDLANELRRLGELLVDDRMVSFEVEVGDFPPSFVTDSLKLRTVLRNLVSNAAKFTTTGEIRVRFACVKDQLCFSVRDTGPGISAEHIEIIFEPFRQIDGSSTRAHGGIGLGLALSRKLARLLGGDILAESEPGRGSVFTLAIPHRAATEMSVGRASAPSAAADSVH
jgi:signal transduction histidine kinase